MKHFMIKFYGTVLLLGVIFLYLMFNSLFRYDPLPIKIEQPDKNINKKEVIYFNPHPSLEI